MKWIITQQAPVKSRLDAYLALTHSRSCETKVISIPLTEEYQVQNGLVYEPLLNTIALAIAAIDKEVEQAGFWLSIEAEMKLKTELSSLLQAHDVLNLQNLIQPFDDMDSDEQYAGVQLSHFVYYDTFGTAFEYRLQKGLNG